MNFKLPMLLMLSCLTAGTAIAEQSVVIVLDTSGSMRTRLRSNLQLSRMQAAKNALTTVLEDIPQETNVGLLVFNSHRLDDRWVFPLGQHSKSEIRSAVQSLQAGGGTPLGQAMKDAADALLAAREKNPIGTFRLLVLTDGEASDSQKLQQYLPDVLSRGLVLDVIGVDMQQNHSLATKVHNYRKADDPQALAQGIAAVFAETDPANDAADDDFELLEGFPPEVAAASLMALTQVDNQPIGTIRQTQTNGPNRAQNSSQPAAPPQPGNHNQPQGDRGGPGAFFWLLILAMVVGFFGSVVRKLKGSLH